MGVLPGVDGAFCFLGVGKTGMLLASFTWTLLVCNVLYNMCVERIGNCCHVHGLLYIYSVLCILYSVCIPYSVFSSACPMHFTVVPCTWKAIAADAVEGIHRVPFARLCIRLGLGSTLYSP